MSDQIAAIKDHLDVVAGTQIAMATALKLVLTSYKAHPDAINALRNELEEMRASLLASSASDRKLEAFEGCAESLLAALT